MSQARVLIVGGYGVFGGRLVALLEDEPRLTLIVAGRSLQRAEELVRRVGPPRSSSRPCSIATETSRRSSPRSRRRSSSTRAVRFKVRSGALPAHRGMHRARASYLDLADGAEFVAGVGALDAQARAAGVFCLAGASTFPMLTAAVVRRLAQGMPRVARYGPASRRRRSPVSARM